MALNDFTVTHGSHTPTFAAPTAAEEITAADDRTYLAVIPGATATTVTLVGKGTTRYGEPMPNKVFSALTGTNPRFFKIDKQFRDLADGKADVQFTPLTTVTATVIRFR